MKSIWKIVHNNEDDKKATHLHCHHGTLCIMDISLALLWFIDCLSVACPGVSCNLIWAASLSGGWSQLKPLLHRALKHPLQALTQSRLELRMSQPPWRSGSCLDLASIDTCHCQACTHIRVAVLLTLFGHSCTLCLVIREDIFLCSVIFQVLHEIDFWVPSFHSVNCTSSVNTTLISLYRCIWKRWHHTVGL